MKSTVSLEPDVSSWRAYRFDEIYELVSALVVSLSVLWWKAHFNSYSNSGISMQKSLPIIEVMALRCSCLMPHRLLPCLHPIEVAASIVRKYNKRLHLSLIQKHSIIQTISKEIAFTKMRIPHATRFILMHTKQNENVGAAARAMKTMGFSDLALVSPNDPKVLQRNKTIQRASGATDVLKGAKIYNSLSDALMDDGSGEEIVCGTGMPVDMYQERLQRNYVEPRKFFDKLMNDKDMIANMNENNVKRNDDMKMIRIAIVFGNEKSGMEEADMDACDYMLGIPTNPKFGSLNLASAVQLIAYDWRMALGYYDDIEQFYPS